MKKVPKKAEEPKINKIGFEIKRNAEAIPCPKCNGYADSVSPTKEELKTIGCTCGDCCGRAFVCRLCKTRWVGIANSPEFNLD